MLCQWNNKTNEQKKKKLKNIPSLRETETLFNSFKEVNTKKKKYGRRINDEEKRVVQFTYRRRINKKI